MNSSQRDDILARLEAARSALKTAKQETDAALVLMREAGVPYRDFVRIQTGSAWAKTADALTELEAGLAHSSELEVDDGDDER